MHLFYPITLSFPTTPNPHYLLSLPYLPHPTYFPTLLLLVLLTPIQLLTYLLDLSLFHPLSYTTPT